MKIKIPIKEKIIILNKDKFNSMCFFISCKLIIKFKVEVTNIVIT